MFLFTSHDLFFRKTTTHLICVILILWFPQLTLAIVAMLYLSARSQWLVKELMIRIHQPLWWRSVARARIWPQAWEPTGSALKRTKKKQKTKNNKKKTKKKRIYQPQPRTEIWTSGKSFLPKVVAKPKGMRLGELRNGVNKAYWHYLRSWMEAVSKAHSILLHTQFQVMWTSKFLF